MAGVCQEIENSRRNLAKMLFLYSFKMQYAQGTLLGAGLMSYADDDEVAGSFMPILLQRSFIEQKFLYPHNQNAVLIVAGLCRFFNEQDFFERIIGL